MSIIKFSKSEAKTYSGIPKRLKASALVLGIAVTTLTSCSVYDECPSEDYGNHADSQDANHQNDIDCTSGNL
ncbi:MAG: hypothetical protein JXR07_18325 [Reichenbachiella sp.]